MPFPFSSNRIRGIRHFGLISRVLIKHGMGEIADRLREKLVDFERAAQAIEATDRSDEFAPMLSDGKGPACPIPRVFVAPWKSWDPVLSSWASL